MKMQGDCLGLKKGSDYDYTTNFLVAVVSGYCGGGKDFELTKAVNFSCNSNERVIKFTVHLYKMPLDHNPFYGT